MSRKIRHINEKPVEGIRVGTRIGFESDLIADREDSALFESIGDYMKGHLDLEDVKNDPALQVMKENVKDMISDYQKNISGNKENEKFISEIISGEGSETGLKDEIKFIKQEINDNKLNDITAEWVREWHEKKQKIGIRDQKTEERTGFIAGAINSSQSEPVKSLNDMIKKSSGRSIFVRYASFSAAALLGAFMLIRTLLPSSNPEKIFDSFYKPFDALSPVTRSVTNNETNNYSSAIESYRSGNYQIAATGFSGALQNDPDIVSSRFFLGLSQLALRNYDQAINLLQGVVNDSGEYGKEARWYLGLTYLKKDNKQKASECFEYLARSEGFYRERSEKILRRLR